MEQIILSVIAQNVQDQDIRPSQHGFGKGRSCLINLISFYDHLTYSVDKGKAVDGASLDITKAFCTISHSTFMEKLAAHCLDRCIFHWVKNCFDG